MDLEIIKQDNQSFRLSDYQIIVSDIKVEGIEMKDNYHDFEGIHGRQLISSVYHKRKIVVPVFFIADNYVDYAIQLDFIFEIIQDNQPFYIRELRKFNKDSYRFKDTIKEDYQAIRDNGDPLYDNEQDAYISGNQYYVKLVNVLNPSQKNNKCNIVFEFETVELPFAQSTGTSMQLHHNEVNNLWGTEIDLDFDDASKRTYLFNHVSSGKIYYHGSVANDQFNMYKKVTIVVGQPTSKFEWSLSANKVMTIKNVQLKPGDVIVYRDLSITRNGISIVDKSNIELPKFIPGFNHFSFNQTVKRVEFDMRFYKK